MRKAALYLLLVFLILPILACGSSDSPADAGETDETAVEEPAETAAEEVAEDDVVPEEEAEPTELPEPTATPEDEAILVFPLEVLDPATPGMFAEVPEGSRLVGTRIAVENQSGEPVGINPLDFVLLDQEGLVVEAELAASDEFSQLSTLALHTNERVEGWVFFVLEESSQPVSIKLTESIFSSEGITVDLAETATPEWEPIAETPEIKLGETAEANGVELTVLSVTDPAPPGILYTATEGTHLVTIEAQLRNVAAEEPVSVNPLYFYLVDNLGFVYEAELGATEQEQIATREIGTGEAIRGFIGYTLPEERTPLYIRYAPNMFDDSEYVEAGVIE